MSFTSVLLIPLAFLAPASSALQPRDGGAWGHDTARNQLWPETVALDEAPGALAFPEEQMRSAQPEPAWQVRIERRMTIRISPRGRAPLPPDMRGIAMPGGPGAPRYEERPMSKCVAAAGIAGVQPERGNRLIFFMRDRRVVSAELDHSCRAMDFYSGFYLAGNEDGKVCVKRDKLQSRSGTKCSLTRMRELVRIRD
ncbi:hypothetical protein [Novosphingobium profundi]|uniref:hypothetical protein n=1 Tax=Novosphingobium profundi TaxID=1774954 RepID=UPI001CFD55BF|nr:hypothetical protein [Novosphingobium profundi]